MRTCIGRCIYKYMYMYMYMHVPIEVYVQKNATIKYKCRHASA